MNAWAWHVDVGDPSSATGSKKLLSGRSVGVKDSVCVAEVPLLLGTNAFEGFIR